MAPFLETFRNVSNDIIENSPSSKWTSRNGGTDACGIRNTLTRKHIGNPLALITFYVAGSKVLRKLRYSVATRLTVIVFSSLPRQFTFRVRHPGHICRIYSEGDGSISYQRKNHSLLLHARNCIAKITQNQSCVLLFYYLLY